MTQNISRLMGLVTVFFFCLFSLLAPLKLSADTPPKPDIIISQLKVTTSSQFVSLYNNTNQAIDMSTVSLQYFNNFQLSVVTSTKNILLAGSLAAHSYYLVNDGPINLCYQTMVQSAPLSFSTKSGMVEVIRLAQQPGGNISLVPQDFVAWSSAKATGAQTIPAEPSFLQRQQASGKPVVNGNWQSVKPSTNNPCELVTTITPSTPIIPTNKLLPAGPAPATIVSIAANSGTKLPISDTGLKAPELTELLPNPASPQTDAEDEFIEVYNSNSTKFDLSGFKLQTASSVAGTKHTYTFPSGTVIAAKSFAAYPSSDISVSLTNSSGLVWLVDPNNAVISKAEPYQTAKDGQAWALADGKWYWTSKPTPNTANVISADDSKKTAGTGVGTVKGASTNSPNTAINNFNSSDASKPRSLNTAILVGVGALALVYGLYEYRRDLANAVQKFKRNRANRRENRPKT